jgi:hypothetical protein
VKTPTDFAALVAEMREQIAKLPTESRHELASLVADVVERYEQKYLLYEQHRLLYEQHRLLYEHARTTATAAAEKLLESVSHDNMEDWLHSTAAPRAEEGHLGDLMLLLNYGRWSERPQGIRLTNRECRILLEILEGKRRPPRRANKKAERAMVVAHYSFLLELDGMPTEATIKRTEALHGVKRSSIFAARKQSPWVGDEPDAETRRALIAAFEATAARS